MEYFNTQTQKWKLDASVFPIAVAGMQCVSLETAVVCSSGPNYYVWHGPGTPWVTSKQTQDRIEMGFTAVAGRWAGAPPTFSLLPLVLLASFEPAAAAAAAAARLP